MLRLRRVAMVAVLFLAANGCGSSGVQWRSRPPSPPGASWHCAATATGSFCEKSADACRIARNYMSQRSVAVHATSADCQPTGEVWCYSYLLSPEHPPSSAELRSVREPGADGWVYDCAGTTDGCQRNQERIVADRGSSTSTSDVSPCERWFPGGP